MEAWRETGDPVSVFAGRLGIDPCRVSRWASRLERSAEATLRFHPVRVAGDDADGRGETYIDIEVGHGRRVRVAPGFATEDLRRVLAVLDLQLLAPGVGQLRGGCTPHHLDAGVGQPRAGTNGTALTAHAPDLNLGDAAWSLSSAPGASVQSGAAKATGAGGYLVPAVIDVGASDVTVGSDIHIGTSPWVGLVVRYTDLNNYLLVRYVPGNLALFGMENGAWTGAWGTYAPTGITAGSTHRLDVTTEGSTISVSWDGTVVFQATRSFNQGAMQHGLFWANYDVESTFDNFDIKGSLLRILSDSFTGPDGTPLDGHAPNVNLTDAQWSVDGAAGMALSGGAAVVGGSGPLFVQAVLAAGASARRRRSSRTRLQRPTGRR